jgi:2-polyprenyl-6-methoxyphenol hydroxylase-like FAD-dependent oxidoreductase
MSKAYDAIVVGARCAGSPTAMLLARRGHRVLLVDRATFPSDTISTHLVHPPGIASLERWGLLDPVIATGSPPIDTYARRLVRASCCVRPRADQEPTQPPTPHPGARESGEHWRQGQAARRR